MPRHYPRPSFARRTALGLIQAMGLGAGLMVLTWFVAGHCLTTPTAVGIFVLFAAAFAPMTLTTAHLGPRGTSRPMKVAAFGYFFASLIALTLLGPDTMCMTAPSALVSAAYVALGGGVLWGALLVLGVRGPGPVQRSQS